MIKFNDDNNFFVITGGPGVGKTTLLQELKKRNYKIVPEIARELIKEQKEKDGDALPWKNRELYKDLMFKRSIESYKHIEEKERPIFFDRGFLDSLCYAKLIDSEIDREMKTYAENLRYNKIVFLLPPWLEIYETDSERKQDWNEVILTNATMIETYKTYGYDIIEVPKKPVSERAQFILDYIISKCE